MDEWLGGGSSLEGNGVNFNFTFNGKPFLLRVEKDDFHTEMWMKDKRKFWSDEKKEYKDGLDVNWWVAQFVKMMVGVLTHHRTQTMKNIMMLMICYHTSIVGIT